MAEADYISQWLWLYKLTMENVSSERKYAHLKVLWRFGNNMYSIETVATNKQLFTMDIAVLCGNRLSYFDESVDKVQAAINYGVYARDYPNSVWNFPW